jgi:Na+-driven multidrug efflux pump
MITQLSGAIVNIILDPILIFGLCGLPELGIKGAAIATVIGQAVAGIVGIILNLTVNPEITLKIKNFLPKARLLTEMLIIAIPSVLMQAIGSVMTFSMNNILLKFSESALNVFGIYFKLQSFIFMPVFGLNNGIVPIVAYNYGAQKRKRMTKTVSLGVAYAVGYMALGFLVFQLFPETLLALFHMTDEHTLAIAVPCLRTISISFVFAGFCIIIGSVFQALGKSIYSMFVSIARQLVVLVPVATLLARLGEVTAVWWAFPIAEVVSVIASVIFFVIIYRHTIAKIPE